jgi:hypothetical protein
MPRPGHTFWMQRADVLGLEATRLAAIGRFEGREADPDPRMRAREQARGILSGSRFVVSARPGRRPAASFSPLCTSVWRLSGFGAAASLSADRGPRDQISSSMIIGTDHVPLLWESRQRFRYRCVRRPRSLVDFYAELAHGVSSNLVA